MYILINPHLVYWDLKFYLEKYLIIFLVLQLSLKKDLIYEINLCNSKINYDKNSKTYKDALDKDLLIFLNKIGIYQYLYQT